MKKEKQIHLYICEKDYNIIKRAAQAKNMNVNEFIRYCCSYYIDNTYTRNYVND